MCHHTQTGNRDDFLSLCFGWTKFGVKDALRSKKYREYLYHAGVIENGDKIIEKATSNNFELDRVQKFNRLWTLQLQGLCPFYL